LNIGFFSPLPPDRTGVADYSAALLPALRTLAPVGVGDERAAAALYHLGNNSLHRGIYLRALEKPGLVVLHDAVLHHFLLGLLDEGAYVDEFCFNYGPWAESLARTLWRQRARSAADPRYFSYPMLRRIVQRSLGVVVHNPGAAHMVREHVPDARIYEIPHLYAASAARTPEQVEALRSSFGFPAGAFLFGVFGHLRESKRVFPILRAFTRVREEASVGLLLAGSFASSDLERAMRPWLGQPGIFHTGYTPEDKFNLHAAAVDAGLSLRFPAAGETSGITIRLMGSAKPVMITRGLETSRFPESACVRIDSGPAEEEMIAEAMVWLARDRESAVRLGEQAAGYIAAHHAAGLAARSYLKALTDCYHLEK
jgi:glycosyltransferase involved in cell wall biosynthesis